MGRKKKYNNETERLEAKRASARNSYHRRKQDMSIDEEFNRLLKLNPDLFHTKQKLNDEQKSYIKSLINAPLDPLPTIKRKTRHNESIAKQQFGLAQSMIRNKKRKSIQSIDFNVSLMKSKQERQYFYEHFPDVIISLLDSINFNTEHWMIYYQYDNHWKSRTLDDTTERYLRDQIKHELQEHIHDFIEYNEDYDFFPVMIQSLNQLRIINVDNTPLINTLKSQSIKPIKRKKREGKFWRWFIKGFDEIDLTRFMIFHKLDKQVAQLINHDNCFVYACQQSGLSDELLNELRYSFHKRSMSNKEIKQAAIDCDLKLHIKESDRSYVINPSGKNEVKMVLMFNHYMIDDKVNVSPYYILHKQEILNDKNTKYWKRTDKMRIIGKSDGYYVKSPKTAFSLRKVIDALFQVKAFEPITMNDYRVYCSLVCFENIDPIKSLLYDPNYCCRLKSEQVI